MRFVSSGAVYRDDAGTSVGLDGVGGEALAVGDVVNLDLLELDDAGGVQQPGINGAGAVVLKFGVRHARAMQLGLQQGDLHGDTVCLYDGVVQKRHAPGVN